MPTITQQPQFVITPPLDLLLRGSDMVPVGLYQLRLATADQLTRAHYSPGSLKAIKARLKQLVDHGYVESGVRPTENGNGPFYYALGPRGISYLSSLGYDVSDVGRIERSPADNHHYFLRHTFGVSDVVISAALVRFATLNRVKLAEFIHEHRLKQEPFVVSYKERLSEKSAPKQRTVKIIPDALLRFQVGDQLIPFLLEHDEGTEGQAKFRAKIRAYAELLKRREYVNRLHAERVWITFTTFRGLERVVQMVAWTQAELAATKESADIAQTFRFAYLPESPTEQVWFEPHWYAPYPYTGQIEPAALLAA